MQLVFLLKFYMKYFGLFKFFDLRTKQFILPNDYFPIIDIN